jgi:hypothetical protein
MNEGVDIFNLYNVGILFTTFQLNGEFDATENEENHIYDFHLETEAEEHASNHADLLGIEEESKTK